MPLRLSQAAEADLIAIYLESSARFGPPQAESYAAGLRAAFDHIASWPRAARLRREMHAPVRVHRFKAHLILYAIEGQDVVILRIRHGREDWLSDPG